MNKRNVFLWTLYDFANSIVTIVFFLYFSQWLVIDHGVSDLGYNLLHAVSSLLLLLTAPILGSIADRTGQQQSYLNRITILVVLFYVGVSFVALFAPNQVFLAMVFFVFASYFYQFSFVFYNALLPKLAPANLWGRISGIGQAGNWLGQITGLLITLPLASGAVYLFGQAGRAQTFLPATIVFFLLALPMLILFKTPVKEFVKEKLDIRGEYKKQWLRFKDLISVPNVGLFLLGYFFFNDAIVTSANNFPIYLQSVFAVSDGTKSLLMIGILATSVFGALASGWAADRLGLKKTLMIVLGSWIVILPALGLVTNFRLFVVLTIAMGLLYGAIWTVTRAFMTAICPSDKLNFGFSFYTLAERVSTLVGPLSWGLITTLLVDMGPVRYRLAVISMSVFVLIGVAIVHKINLGNPNVQSLT